MSEIFGNKISLRDLFSDKYIFSIPEYQRPYSWQKDNCTQLFEDINESDRHSEYFLGTIILHEVEKIGNTVIKYDIIDGQQRLTTIQLLLAVLRDAVEDVVYKDSVQKKIYQYANPAEGIKEKIRLTIREKEFFKSFVQDSGSTCRIKDYSPQNSAQKNLFIAINTFKDNISTFSQAQIRGLIEHLLQRCIFIFVSTKEFEDAYRLFTIINDRGLQLRRIDILKTNNLDPSFIQSEQERKEYAKIWEDMENELGSENFENLISFIRTIEIKEKAKEDILKEFNKLIFGKGKIEKGIEFIDYVKRYKEIYQRLIFDRDINLGNKTISYKNLIHIMTKFLPSNEWIPVLLLYYNKFGTNMLFDFLKKLEMKFVADWVTALTPTKRTVNMNLIMKDIEIYENPIHVINSKYLVYDEKRFIEELSQDSYGKRHVTYILLKLEYLESEQNIERKYDTLSVEHVLPQSPKKGSNWFCDFKEEEMIFWTNKLANLVLLSKRKNSSASNLDFKDKKTKYLSEKITDLGRSQKVLSYDNWTPKVLVERQHNIIKLLSKQENNN